MKYYNIKDIEVYRTGKVHLIIGKIKKPLTIQENKQLKDNWNKLKELQSKTERPMKYNKYSVFDLEERFKNE